MDPATFGAELGPEQGEARRTIEGEGVSHERDRLETHVGSGCMLGLGQYRLERETTVR